MLVGWLVEPVGMTPTGFYLIRGECSSRGHQCLGSFASGILLQIVKIAGCLAGLTFNRLENGFGVLPKLYSKYDTATLG